MTTLSLSTASGERVSVEIPDGTVHPVRAHFERVVHTASNNRVSWIGRQVVVSMSDETRRHCAHTSGHRSTRTATACATKLVARLWAEQGIDLADLLKGA